MKLTSGQRKVTSVLFFKNVWINTDEVSREIEKLKSEMQEMKEQYEKKMRKLSKSIEALEARSKIEKKKTGVRLK